METPVVLDPDIPIVDAHHHLWDGAHPRYLVDEFYRDLNKSGHNVVASIFAECKSMYRSSGATEYRPVGEAEFAEGCAAVGASGVYGPAKICSGIVGHADLALGERIVDVLQKLKEAGGERFRGIRYILANDPDVKQQAPHDILQSSSFRAGFSRLADVGLAFDAWLYHPQLEGFCRFAADFPEIPIVFNHAGGLIGMGRFASRKTEAFAQWRKSLAALAELPNTSIKLGGLTMPVFGLGLDAKKPSTHEGLANRIQPIVDACIEAFGTRRCMFESNFPVNREMCCYRNLWNAYKLVLAGYSEDEKKDLLGKNAVRFYGITLG